MGPFAYQASSDDFDDGDAYDEELALIHARENPPDEPSIDLDLYLFDEVDDVPVASTSKRNNGRRNVSSKGSEDGGAMRDGSAQNGVAMSKVKGKTHANQVGGGDTLSEDRSARKGRDKGKGKARDELLVPDSEPMEVLESDEEMVITGYKPANGDSGVDEEGSSAEIRSKLAKIQAEIASVADQINELTNLKSQLKAEKAALEAKLVTSSHSRNLNDRNAFLAASSPQRKTASNASGSIDYFDSNWQWTSKMKETMREVWDIQSFRLCQEGVCNAVMDGRDVAVVMPTGGGKSLTYQLPAILSPGCTLVISPLIALMTDQIFHLREAGVEAVMLTGSTSKSEAADIMKRLTQGGSNQVGSSRPNGKKSVVRAMGDFGEDPSKPIKLCYVTPEKLAKSKTFVSTLQKMYNAGLISRFVIDEAHCCSQLGHDYRPDYKKLSILKTLFPDVPIVALTATCPPRVLDDLLKILKLGRITDGRKAAQAGTVYFSAPLYRKNLHYSVVPKPASAQGVIEALTEYILEKHAGESGIVYCLSQKDTETVAQGMYKISEGKIKTGIYHAGLADGDKESIHTRWRTKRVQVVVATIAFGLGIDSPDVRFVLHHTMSKSLEGYYQESGRAGRDGKDSDCVLFYRGQDASRMSSLVCQETEGPIKLHAMLGFANDVKSCRKLLFLQYFKQSGVSSASFTSDDKEGEERCGHCDNVCTRSPESILSPDPLDLTLYAWRALKILRVCTDSDGRVTLTQMADLVRGLGGGSFGLSAGGEGGKKGKGKGKLSLDEVAGGKVELGKDEVESFLIHLLTEGFLEESYNSTAYAITTYLMPGPKSMRLLRVTKADAHEKRFGALEISMSFPKISGTGKGKAKSKGASGKKSAAGGSKAAGKKRKKGQVDESESDDEVWQGDGGGLGEGGQDSDGEWDFVAEPAPKPSKRPRRTTSDQAPKSIIVDID